MPNNKLIVILGPTASGKSDLAVKLAKKYNGEIISADSRQVYKGMDTGSAKITKKEMKGIPHFLLDVANPKRKFTVAQFQKLAAKAINDIQKRNKIPFLVGGTGFYIQSIVDSPAIPEVKPNWKLRNELSKKTSMELYEMLCLRDPERAKTIDKNNPYRLIRALEIIMATGKPVPKINKGDIGKVLQIGIAKSPDDIKKAIHLRLLKRMKQNALINEVKRLRRSGLSWKRLEEFGLEYRYVAQYLQNKITCQEMMEHIEKATWHLAKKQLSWFKRDKRIHWINSQKEAWHLVDTFIKL